MFFLKTSLCGRRLPVFAILLTGFSVAGTVGAAGAAGRVEFVDSATGFAVVPEEVKAVEGTRGSYSVKSEGYRVAEVTFPEVEEGYRIRVLLEPVETPEPLRPESVDALRRQDATVFLGYVADENGEPVPGVRVRSFPSGVEERSGGDGFFVLSVPLQTEEERAVSPAGLVFEKEGFDLEEIRGIELFPYGDWTYRVRLRKGEGVRVTDEAAERRRESPEFSLEEASRTPAPEKERRIAAEVGPLAATAQSSEAKIRVPTHIRVLLQDESAVEYVPMELYVRRSLPQEWIASWGNYSGGEHSLRAGAVAIRTYAIGFVNNPRAVAYDICATATCQVYRPTTNQLTDAAVEATKHFVMVDGSGTIKRGLTEYSAENNSLGFGCGDGFTQPSGGCIADPICSGEERYGHGRGLCQWGSARWATGRRMANRKTSDGTPAGFPKKTWTEILGHYYPHLSLVQGVPLSVGDTVRVSGSSVRPVRLCSDGGIANGENCPQIATKSPGSIGLIVDGPRLVTADGIGYTWWKVRWNDATETTGWSAENWLERAVAAPSEPVVLSAGAVSSTRVELSWDFSSDSATGFRIERSSAAGGPWSEIETVSAETRSFEDVGLVPETGYHYRVRAFNSGGNSAPSNVVSVVTPGLPAEIDPIADRMADVGELLAFSVSASAPERVFPITDFENFGNNTVSGTVLFRAPSFSGSTSGLIETTPNDASVRSVFPAGNGSERALYLSWSWKSGGNPWLRLTTSNTSNLGNPVIDFTKKLRFRIWTDRDLKVALGLRETETAAGTPIGSRGGTSGGIEFVGISGKTGSAPVPVRTVQAGGWRVVEFDPMKEPVMNYSGGNGVLESATGLGVLEHLALVPADGAGGYEVYLDDFEQVEERKILFSLGAGAPEGAAIDEETGVFSWTPLESQGGKTFEIEVLATTAGPFGQTVSETFSVVVNPGMEPPVLGPIPDLVIHPGQVAAVSVVVLNAEKTFPPLSFELGEGSPAGAAIDSESGEFSWVTGVDHAGRNHPVTIRVYDGGNPPNRAEVNFGVAVTEPVVLKVAEAGEGEIRLSWEGIEGAVYRIQTTSELDGTWVDLLPEIIGDDGLTMFVLPVEAGDSKRFYRVLLVQ